MYINPQEGRFQEALVVDFVRHDIEFVYVSQFLKTKSISSTLLRAPPVWSLNVSVIDALVTYSTDYSMTG